MCNILGLNIQYFIQTFVNSIIGNTPENNQAVIDDSQIIIDFVYTPVNHDNTCALEEDGHQYYSMAHLENYN